MFVLTETWTVSLPRLGKAKWTHKGRYMGVKGRVELGQDLSD